MGCSFGQIGRPYSHVCVLSLMDSHVWWPDSVMDLTLAVIPLLEIITSVLLMAWMYFWQKYHPLGELTLSETFVNEQVVFLMHGTVAALARSAEDLETSAETKIESG